MQPGLARAVPMGILGFVGGALLAIVIRLAQGLPAEGFVGPAFVLGAFISAGTFVWGMGGFDPKMNVHGEHADEHSLAEVKVEKTTPAALLGSYTWQIAFWTILGVVAVGAFAFLPGGPNIRNVHPGQGDVASVGFVFAGDIYNPVREFLQTATGVDLIPPLAENLASIEISYLVLFLAFVGWTILSLFLIGALIAFLLSYFGRGKQNPDATPIPWRVLVFIAGLAGPFLTLPLLVPSRAIPMAIAVPFFLIPQLLLLIAYRRAIWAILLLIALPLPVLVPTVNIDQVAYVLFAVIGVGVLALILNIIRSVLAERTWRIMSTVVLSVAVIGVIVYAIGLTRGDFWQLLFALIVTVFSLLLLLPVWYLKLVIPASMWSRFANINWNMLIPEAAAWLANLLRSGLPNFLGQK
ncbi:MAG: hypothetical protein J0L63_09875 [Anaerolineae bacterium]|nr:hypothetical protein [Anaerolineae bacterium]MBN8619203.1 hypothetical protein [Anaerolineae bacterium]